MSEGEEEKKIVLRARVLAESAKLPIGGQPLSMFFFPSPGSFLSVIYGDARITEVFDYWLLGDQEDGSAEASYVARRNHSCTVALLKLPLPPSNTTP